MLIMITNKCNENCSHCMENSNPNGGHIDDRTFYKAVMFAKFIGSTVVTISGGEPTLHPDFFRYCKELNDIHKIHFVVVSNGTWCDDEKIVRQVRRMCSDFQNFIGMQVYTNKLFYKDYDKIMSMKTFFASFGGKVILDDSPILAMKDLGRARKCELALRMCEESQYHQSCLNANLAARQIKSPRLYGATLERISGQFCHPMVDFNGGVHLSESWLCQSVGNVTIHTFDSIWDCIRDYHPCGECRGYKWFKGSSRKDIVEARRIIETNEQQY